MKSRRSMVPKTGRNSMNSNNKKGIFSPVKVNATQEEEEENPIVRKKKSTKFQNTKKL